MPNYIDSHTGEGMHSDKYGSDTEFRQKTPQLAGFFMKVPTLHLVLTSGT